MVKFLFVLIVSVFVLAATSFAKPASLDDWVQEQKVYSFERIHKILGTADKPYAGVPYGAVIASPSQSDPNYFYHWVRDAALVMASLDQYSGDQSESRRNENVFNAFARRVKIHQESAKISDLGEPKFYLDGRGYSEPWGRPQNDGPALRALFLMQRANKLLQQGKTQAVKESFFNEGLPATTLVKRDLEYVSHQWRNPDFDLWEEVKGQHFYTRMVQMLALRKGSEFAAKLGEPLAARWYAEQAKEIKDSIAQHHRGPYIKSHIIRVGGLDYKESSLDASVLLAFNHTKINPLLWDGLTEKYWQTFTELWQSFGSIYKINHNLPGVVFGR
jgi:glucoamylase